MLVDLQIYLVPRDRWVLCRRLYRHTIIEEGISLGFIRVLPQLSIHNLRRELHLQLSPDLIPREFIFVRAVGNIFIQLKPKQEIELKVKNFIPPFAPDPELYILEVLPNEDQDPRLTSGGMSSSLGGMYGGSGELFGGGGGGGMYGGGGGGGMSGMEAERRSPVPASMLIREDTPPHICHEFCHHTLARRRDKILREIAENVQMRHDAELRRAELIQRANDLQTLIKEKRDKIARRQEFWHKKYIEESSMTRPLEAACNSLRAELNTVHRRLLAHLEGRDLPLRLRDGPSKKANYKIMAARLQHEIKELQQKAKSAKLRLESEIKLKEQGEREVRELRNDLAHKKVIMSLARSQISALPSVHPNMGYDSLGY